MREEKTTGGVQKTYVKPVLEKVELVIDALIGQTCKTGGQAGPNANNCAPGQGCPRQAPS
jgi:hypothetical protein